MFGNSDWFGDSKGKKVLKPAEKKGWMYYGTWAAVIVVPFLMLAAVTNLPKALIWLVVAALVFGFDYRKVLNSKREGEAFEQLFFIGDETPPARSETENYEVFIKE